ncbi:MAG: hypothetical protein LBE59_07845 [Nevskiaceae bacterium]|nr:hypothetical protein [Nevskiaceae bacterium]
MANDEDFIDWSLTTFDGVRREQLRRARTMTVAERLEALDELSKVAIFLHALPLRYPKIQPCPSRSSDDGK